MKEISGRVVAAGKNSRGGVRKGKGVLSVGHPYNSLWFRHVIPYAHESSNLGASIWIKEAKFKSFACRNKSSSFITKPVLRCDGISSRAIQDRTQEEKDGR